MHLEPELSRLQLAGELLLKVEASLNTSSVLPENAPKKGNGMYGPALAKAQKLVAAGWVHQIKDLPSFTASEVTVAGAGSERLVRQWVH